MRKIPQGLPPDSYRLLPKEITAEVKNPRSRQYQFLFNETSYHGFNRAQGYGGHMEGWIDYQPDESEPYSDELQLLLDKRAEILWRIVEETLTDRQYQVVFLMSVYDKDGFPMSQDTAAKILGINQSSITKGIAGNVDYKDGKRKSQYGGSAKKLREAARKNKSLQQVLEMIEEVRSRNERG